MSERYESSITSLSWIPSEAIKGLPRLPFDMGVTHYDDPPPEELTDLNDLMSSGRSRFANELRAWVEVEDGRIVAHGHSGQGHIGRTLAGVGPMQIEFRTIPFPDLQAHEVVGDSEVRFRQTAGGRTSLPAPRRVARKPFLRFVPPLAWTTLELKMRADGSSSYEVTGASTFPRHWIYDNEGRLVAKTGVVDFERWYRSVFDATTPWGEEDSPALVTAAETAIERELSRTIMKKNARPRRRSLGEGETLVEQGDAGDDLFLLLDGVLTVEVDNESVAEVGPGAILGERAVLEGGVRTSTLRAVTPCRVVVVGADQVDRAALEEVSRGHRREEQGRPPA
jgi:Cyclic nucleotide-binding domain